MTEERGRGPWGACAFHGCASRPRLACRAVSRWRCSCWHHGGPRVTRDPAARPFANAGMASVARAVPLQRGPRRPAEDQTAEPRAPLGGDPRHRSSGREDSRYLSLRVSRGISVTETLVPSAFGLTHKVQACGGPEASRATLPGPSLQPGASEKLQPGEGAPRVRVVGLGLSLGSRGRLLENGGAVGSLPCSSGAGWGLGALGMWRPQLRCPRPAPFSWSLWPAGWPTQYPRRLRCGFCPPGAQRPRGRGLAKAGALATCQVWGSEWQAGGAGPGGPWAQSWTKGGGDGGGALPLWQLRGAGARHTAKAR